MSSSQEDVGRSESFDSETPRFASIVSGESLHSGTTHQRAGGQSWRSYGLPPSPLLVNL